MARKYEKEYKKFIFNLNLWIRKTKQRIEMLPQMEYMSQLNYDQWFELFKEESLPKSNIPAPQSPPDNEKNKTTTT